MPALSEGAGNLVVLDACCVINLFATGRAEEILRAFPGRFAVARFVAEAEVLEIDAGEGGESAARDEGRVSLRPLIADLVGRGVLQMLDIVTEEEKRQLVRFAAQLDDGEAHTCALAVVRGARVATDDKKAIRVYSSAWESQDRRGVPVLRTSEILFSWAAAQRVGHPDLVRVVRAIARRASFFPPKEDPHSARWMKLLAGGD